MFIIANYSYVEPTNGLLADGQLAPVIDTTVSNELYTTVSNETDWTNMFCQIDIERNCGDDNVCVPDVELKAES